MSEIPDENDLPKHVTVRAFGAKLLGGKPAQDQVHSVLRLQNNLWNKLVEIERASRQAYNEALAQSDTDLAALIELAAQQELAVQALLDARNKERAKDRRKKTDNSQNYAALIKNASDELKTTRALIKEGKARAKAAAKPLIEQAELARRATVKEAAAQSGLWWSHKDAVLARYDTARVRAMKTGKMLQFHRYDGVGSMTIRIGSSAAPQDWAAILAGRTTMITVREPTPKELGRKKAVASDGTRRMVVTVRAGDKAEDKSIPKLDFMVAFHPGCDMPADAPLRTVTLKRDMHVDKEEWKIVFMYSRAGKPEDAQVDLPAQAVGIDFGFRLVRGEQDNTPELRVAAISTGDKVRYVTLEHAWLRRMQRADRLRSELDELSNGFWLYIKPLLTVEALSGLAEDEWFRVLAGKVTRAKGAYTELLRQLCRAHQQAGMPLGEEVEQRMQDYSKQALRMALQAHHTRRRALDHRKHIYRNVAAQIAASTGMVGLEDVDFRQLAQLENPDGTENDLAQAARKYRTWAAPSELRLAIEQACKREKREVVSVPAPDTTRTCSACGHVHPAGIEDLTFVCQGCGKVWDQDENAAHNIRNVVLEHA